MVRLYTSISSGFSHVFPIFSCEFPSWLCVSQGVFGISAPGCCGPSFPPAAAVVPPLGPVPSSSLGTDVFMVFFDVERWKHMVKYVYYIYMEIDGKYMVKYVVNIYGTYMVNIW
jgi:hypothetical protein